MQWTHISQQFVKLLNCFKRNFRRLKYLSSYTITDTETIETIKDLYTISLHLRPMAQLPG